MNRLCESLLTDSHRQRLREALQVDAGYGHPELGRFRVNVFFQRGEPQAALRLVPARVRDIRELNLPPVVERIAAERRGLVLVTGTTGSGKSTTLVSMIDHVNRSADRHMITVEDPIEYLHRDDKSVISQREIGVDCTTFAAGLKGSLRQDPTSSWWARCAISRRSRPRSWRPRRGTSPSRRSTRSTPPRPSRVPSPPFRITSGARCVSSCRTS